MNRDEESQFLHELSNAVGVALLISDGVLEAMQTRPNAPPAEVANMRDIFASLKKAQELLLARKSVLRKRAEENHGS